MRQPAKIKVLVHCPKTEDGKRELARRVARVHADAIEHRIRHLKCPDRQRQALFDAVIQSAHAEIELNKSNNIIN